MPVQRKERRERFKAHDAQEGISHRRSITREEALVPSLTDLTLNTTKSLLQVGLYICLDFHDSPF